MKNKASPLTFSPFEKIDALFRNKPSESRPRTSQPLPASSRNKKEEPAPLDDEAERRCFLEIMKKEGIKPFIWNRSSFRKTGKPAVASPSPDELSEVLLHLQLLVEGGEGFHVAQTPEYIEGTGAFVPSSYARRLHRGDFSIQSHIDLHGMNAKEARQAFNAFMKDSVSTGKRAVLVIHGRGLSSPAEPVLKNGIQSWLTSRAWRKWVIAYASAQSFDGGAGATYVLLRVRPFSGGFRKAPDH